MAAKAVGVLERDSVALAALACYGYSMLNSRAVSDFGSASGPVLQIRPKSCSGQNVAGFGFWPDLQNIQLMCTISYRQPSRQAISPLTV